MKASEFKTGSDELDKLIHTEISNVKGFPLKSERAQTSKTSDGKEQVTKSTTLVTELKETKIADSQFAVPAGFTETPLIPAPDADDASGAASGKGQTTKPNPFADMMKLLPKRAP